MAMLQSHGSWTHGLEKTIARGGLVMVHFFHQYNPFQFMRRSRMEESYKEPPARLQHIETEWIATKECRKHLRQVCQQWYHPAHKSLLDDLNLIQWEVIAGDQRIQPYPSVACAANEGLTIGALSGRPNYVHQYFFIEEVAVHPGYASDYEAAEKIINILVEAAIDYSLELGFRGWVACDADTKHLDVLKHSGFHPHDPFTYRKMGYFA